MTLFLQDFRRFLGAKKVPDCTIKILSLMNLNEIEDLYYSMEVGREYFRYDDIVGFVCECVLLNNHWVDLWWRIEGRFGAPIASILMRCTT